MNRRIISTDMPLISNNQISLKLIIPCAMLFSMLLTFFFAYMDSRRVILSRVEKNQIILVKDHMNALQGILENRHTTVAPGAIQQTLSFYGAAADLDSLLLADHTGTIIASTRYQDIGRSWKNPVAEPFALTKQSIEVQLSQDRKWLDAYVSICTTRAGSLRKQRCGMLYYRKNLQYHKDIALADLYHMFF